MSSTTITVFVRLLHPYFIFLWISPHLSNTIIYTPNNIKMTNMFWCNVCRTEIKSTTQQQVRNSFILIIGYELWYKCTIWHYTPTHFTNTYRVIPLETDFYIIYMYIVAWTCFAEIYLFIQINYIFSHCSSR
jgi:hypothetical protein